jgi:hypothetical protein
MRMYSDFFKTLHDETGPTGYLGQGTHHSVLRAVAFHDPMGSPLSEGRFTDFAVIWDVDHDVRVLEPIEGIYRLGLLSSFVMFGEHKGTFTAVLSDRVSPSDESHLNPVLFRKVSDLDLSVRASNILSNENIIYVGDLVQKSMGQILRMPNTGRKSLDEIREMLAQMDLQLGTEVPDWPPENVEELAANVEHLIKKFEARAHQDERVAFLGAKVKEVCQSLSDPWPSNVVNLLSPGSIIVDGERRVAVYLENLKLLWRLGLHPLKRVKKVSRIAPQGANLPESALP